MEFVLLPWLFYFPHEINSAKLNRAAEGHGYPVEFVLLPWLLNTVLTKQIQLSYLPFLVLK